MATELARKLGATPSPRGAARQEFAAALVDAVAAPVMLTDAAGTVLAANPALVASTGRPRDALIGCTPPYPWWSGAGAPTVSVAAVVDPLSDTTLRLWSVHETPTLFTCDAVVSLEMVRDVAAGIVDAVVVAATGDAVIMAGVPARDVPLGERLVDIDPGNAEAYLRACRQTLTTDRAREIEMPVTDSHRTRIVRARLSPRGDVVTIAARDVTIERTAEDSVRQATRQRDFVADCTAVACLTTDSRATIDSLDAAAATLLGGVAAELVGTDVVAHIHPDDRERVRRHHDELVGGTREMATLTYRQLTDGGGEMLVEAAMHCERVRHREAARVMWVVRAVPARPAAGSLDELAALRRVATAVAVQGDAEAVMETVTAEIAALFSARTVRVCRFDGDDRVSTLGFCDDAAAASPRILSRHENAALDAIRAAATAGSPLRHDLSGPVVTAPVHVGTRSWGAIVMTRGAGQTPPDIHDRLERFANLASVAVSAAEDRAQLAAQAVTDPLTGLPNHRAFHEALRVEVARAQRHGYPLSLALIDLDHFNRLNEVHGHQEGDRALREVALRLGASARPGEMVARVGGEEFGWILHETDAAGANEAVEQARAAIARRPLVGGRHVTVSAGVCDLVHASNADELVRLADGALYWAKANGRDLACIYTPEVVDILSAEERAERLERGQALLALRVLARAVDAKDASTHAHSERVAQLSHDLALALDWLPERALLLRNAAMVHDVGKIGVPDAVLLKAGSLHDDEFEVIKRHAALGAEITSDALTAEQCSWVRHHHEHWDGRGYPDGLSGDDIPDGARLIAVADAWDVMTRARHYTTIRSTAAARAEIDRCSGSQFWPPAVQALLGLPATDDRLAIRSETPAPDSGR